MKKQFSQVLEFHKLFNSYIAEKPTSDIPSNIKKVRIQLIQEETDELIDTIENKNLPEIAKELADVFYVLIGTAISFGLHKHFERIFTSVHKSNLSKMSNSGTYELSENGQKVLKGKSYKLPKFDFLEKE